MIKKNNSFLVRKDFLNVGKNFDAILDIMAEGYSSVRNYLDTLNIKFNNYMFFYTNNIEYEGLDEDTKGFEGIYTAYQQFRKRFRQAFEQIDDMPIKDEGVRFQTATILILDMMNIRGQQLEYALEEFAEGSTTNLIKTLASTELSGKLINAVNVNSAKTDFDDMAVPNRYLCNDSLHPKLTEKQIEWFKTIPDSVFNKKDKFVR